MKRVKSFSILGIIFVAVLVLLMPCWANVNNSTKAVVAQSNECFQIEVFGRSGSKIEIVEPVDYKHQTIQTNLKAFRFYWKDVERFVFRVNPETYSPTPDEQDSYTMTISIEFLKGYWETPNFNQANLITVDDYDLFTRTSTGDFNGITNFSPELNIDEGVTAIDTTGKQVSFGDWGIYRFIMNINDGNDVYSDFFIIEPEKEIYYKPNIDYREEAPELQYSTYTFSLTNADEFQYIDTTKLVWYVTGQAQGGIKYVLTNDDLASFPEYEHALYPSWDRTGYSFSFNDNGHHGEWTVWCEYKYFQSESEAAVSNKITLITSAAVTFSTLIWVIAGLMLASIIITILICIFKIKREKVY